jgi:hypothetical protein
MGKKKDALCCECKSVLVKDHIALSKKLLGRNTTRFFCITCLAQFLECDAGDLEIKIMEFKEQGCTLFL